MDLQIVVLDEDMPTLEALAKAAFRDPTGQASYLVQRALRTARIDKPERSRSAPRRTPARTNGVARVEA